MKSKNRYLLLLISIFICVCLLSGCTKKIEFAAGKIKDDAADISIVLAPGETSLLNNFTALKTADFSGSENVAEIAQWAAAHPQVSVSYTVTLPDGQTVSSSETEINLGLIKEESADEAAELISCLPELKFINFSAETSPGPVSAIIEKFPEIDYQYSFELLGKSVSTDDKELDLSRIAHEDMDYLMSVLPLMKDLKTAELGSEAENPLLTWDDICAIRTALPDTELNYSFTAFKKELTLGEEELILRHIVMDDEGELAGKIAYCMNNLRTLDMDSCGVSNERMAEIRDALPETDVIWRIVFGRYSVRTDVEHIMASNPGMGGDLYLENTECLKYCTKVKYLDLGHNRTLDSIAFVEYMPDLEVAILAMNAWTDASPLASCPKLEYLELFETGLNDLRPFSELKNLRHLNIGQCYAVTDLSPLYGLKDLERLWIGCNTPVPMEQIKKMQECAPDCEIDYVTEAPLGSTWRFMGKDEFGYTILNPRYILLCEQMGYGRDMASYAYFFNDPLYYGPGHMEIPSLREINKN